MISVIITGLFVQFCTRLIRTTFKRARVQSQNKSMKITNCAALVCNVPGRWQQLLLLLQRIKDGCVSAVGWSKRLQRRRDVCGRSGPRPSATIRALSAGTCRGAGGRGGGGACRVGVGAARCLGRSRPPWSSTWRRRDAGHGDVSVTESRQTAAFSQHAVTAAACAF